MPFLHDSPFTYTSPHLSGAEQVQLRGSPVPFSLMLGSHVFELVTHQYRERHMANSMAASDTVSPTLAAEPAMDEVENQIAFGPDTTQS